MSRFVLDASVVLTWCFPDENAAMAQHVAGALLEVARAQATVHGIIVKVDPKTGHATGITRIQMAPPDGNVKAAGSS